MALNFKEENIMETQNKVELALSHWTNGNREEFKNIIKGEIGNIFNHYEGNGDIYTYFLPALLIEDFWRALQEIDFPLEKIVFNNFDIISWIKWKDAVHYMFSKDPKMLKDYADEGLYEEHFSPELFNKNDRNYQITLDYFNTDMQNQIEILVDHYLSMSDEDWQKIQDNLTEQVNGLKKSVPKIKI